MYCHGETKMNCTKHYFAKPEVECYSWIIYKCDDLYIPTPKCCYHNLSNPIIKSDITSAAEAEKLAAALTIFCSGNQDYVWWLDK